MKPLLTLAERRVVEALCDGLGNKAIARVCDVDPSTVATHMTHVRRKLGTHNQVETILALLRRRLIVVKGINDAPIGGSDVQVS